MKENEFLTTT